MMRIFFLWILFSVFFIFFQSFGIYAGDAGDLVTSAYVHGVAHPPGFPLYTLIAFLLTKLPVVTVAWRVALLSSLSASTSLTILFILINRLTKNTFIALTSVASLGLTYIFWLYSIVPEVFLLNILFEVILMSLLYFWHISKKDSYFFLFVFFLGLSFSHHPIIIFLTPSFAYWIYENRRLLKNKPRIFFLKLLILFVLGLLPYLYIPIAAATNPPINWNNATTLTHFLKLITRADYGTFQSGPNSAQSFISRLLQIPLIGGFLLIDFRPLGALLIAAGALYQFRKARKLFYWLALAFIFSGPVYFFYASYLFTDQFSIATLERFLLPSYAIATVWLAYGLLWIKDILLNILSKLIKKNRLQLEQRYSSLLYLIFLLIPLSFFYINYPRLVVLKTDFTAERFAKDILTTPKKNAIILTERDNALFNMQYAYYIQHIRPDIKLYHFYRLYMGELAGYSKKYYPGVIIPPGKGPHFVDIFIEKNYGKFPIYANTRLSTLIKDGYWVRTGLLLRFYKKNDLPKMSELLKTNDILWQRYFDPLSGSLGQHKNLMLANILDFYAEGHVETGFLFEAVQQYEKAITHYKEAIKLVPDDVRNYIRLSRAYNETGSCQSAQATLENGFAQGLKEIDGYQLMYDIQKNCFKNEKKARLWQQKFEAEKKKLETPLKGL